VPGRCARSLLFSWVLACACAPLVALDPGHTDAHPGAVSVRGIPEVSYNDAFVAVLGPRLSRDGFRVLVTRGPGEEIELSARADRANARRASVLLSIHHDSVQEDLLEEVPQNGRTAMRTVRPVRGYSLFVSGQNPRYEDSLKVAEAIGRRLLALGRPPSLHHAERIPGEGRTLLDERLGIYRFDELAVLREASCPAVLLEVGVLVDEADEAYIADPARREALSEAIAQGLLDARGN